MVVTSNQYNLIQPHRPYPEYRTKPQVPRLDLLKPISAPEVVPQTAPEVVHHKIHAW